MRRRSLVASGLALVVVAGAVMTAALAFPAHPLGRSTSAPPQLPATLEGFVFQLCEPDPHDVMSALNADQAAGSTTESLQISTGGAGGSFSATVEAPGAWSVEAGRGGVSVSAYGTTHPDTAVHAETVAFAQQLYSCMSQYRFVDQTMPPTASAHLVQWYKYDTLVLWPCLTGHGLRLDDPPTRADFADAFRAQAVDPFRGLTVTKRTLPRLLAAVRQCPLHPAYLG